MFFQPANDASETVSHNGKLIPQPLRHDYRIVSGTRSRLR